MNLGFLILPVGKSPVHSYRLLNAINNKNEYIVMLVVSELTEYSGVRIKEISEVMFAEIQVVNYKQLNQS